jgi:ferredoxin
VIKESSVKVIVDGDRCIASGQCVLTAPDVFDQQDEDGIVLLRDDNPPAGLADDVHQAAAVCPALAITVED